jgi:predicted regulator of Ras-like GTPase activity (Roadblock/LC7/MglB family)
MAAYVSSETGKTLCRIVADLLVQSEGTVALLMDTGGNVLARAPDRDDAQLQTIAALAAGAFSATRELAVITGENSFQSVSHEGENTSLHVQLVGEHHLVLVLFQRTTTLGLVKLYARRAVAEAEPILTELERTAPPPPPGHAFVLAGNTDALFSPAEPRTADARA